jgi:nitrate reductase gamma subunit
VTELLAVARGPLLVLAFALLVLGTLRQWTLTLSELLLAYRKAGDQKIPWRWMWKMSLGWIVPVNALRGTRIPFTIVSATFHVGVLVVPVFLAGHVALAQKGTGLSWPALPGTVADTLTVLSLASLAVLLLYRLLDRAVRSLSGAQDYALLCLLISVFVTGLWMAHPGLSPLPFSLVYLGHLLSGELILALLPFSKLAHALLFFSTRLVWELGWHFVPGAGDRVRLALGKEGQGV